MRICFGLQLDEQTHPIWYESPYEAIVGENALIALLEQQVGLRQHPSNPPLRIEQYRQALETHLRQTPEAFYRASFQADALAAAEVLLQWRDELKINGWDFAPSLELPARLLHFAEIEQILAQSQPLTPGFADRFARVYESLHPQAPLPLQSIDLQEPYRILPYYWQRMLAKLQTCGVRVAERPEPEASGQTDLARFQQSLAHKSDPFAAPIAAPERLSPNADGSLIVCTAKRPADLAAFWAKILATRRDFRPVCVLPQQRRDLDTACTLEGLPALGLASASLARPTVQILRLAPVFLWKPLNPYQLLEFVSLPNKPLHDGLAREIAGVLAQKPGLFSDLWKARRLAFFERFDQRAEAHPKRAKSIIQEKLAAKAQYDFWFKRRRYPLQKRAPVSAVVEIYDYIERWAHELLANLQEKIKKLDERIERDTYRPDRAQRLADNKALRHELAQQQPPLLALLEQTRRLLEVLASMPQDRAFIGYLQLERLIRTVQEPTALQLRPAEADHLPFVSEAGAILAEADAVLWWDFIQPDAPKPLAHWYTRELQHLESLGVFIESPAQAIQRQIWQQQRPARYARQRLVLCVPAMLHNRATQPHPLWGDLQACFGGVEAITWDLDNPPAEGWLERYFALPKLVEIAPARFQKTEPYLRIRQPEAIAQRPEESFSSLDALFYYPHQWVFRYQMDLRKSPILSVVDTPTLMGNLAHHAFQMLLTEAQADLAHWDSKRIEAWLDAQLPDLFRTEGAVLLMYGNESERVYFTQRLKRSAVVFIRALQRNGWQIEAVEREINGELAGQKIQGIADLILRRGEREYAVVDFKWSGHARRRELIKNNEDLQLVIYSKLAHPKGAWAHTAYFILENAKLIARSNEAFEEAETVPQNYPFGTMHQQTWGRMEATYQWRMEQLRAGWVEIRTEETAKILEEELAEAPFEQVLQLLEMKKESNRYDIYKVLTGSAQ